MSSDETNVISTLLFPGLHLALFSLIGIILGSFTATLTWCATPQPTLPPETKESSSSQPATQPSHPPSARLHDDDFISNDENNKAQYAVACIVRNDLGMTKGKMAAQASHGVLAVFSEALETNPEASVVLYSICT
ncbi:hypothetical protein HDU76_010381 [Blyttiomyces sp. JEL0837]|nr:hypothetical protein HDU76_010381 [Blyttiomyces sp. JEL0837]